MNSVCHYFSLQLSSMVNNSSTSFTNYSRQDMFDGGITIGLTVLGVIICILDILGNSIVIHIVRTRAHMRTTTNLLIANLAAADLLMVLVVAYLTKHFFVGFDWFKGVFGHVTCKLVLSLQPLSVVASILNLTVITLDRFFAILFPLKTFITIKITKRLMVAIWILSIGFSIPIAVVSKSYPLGTSHICFDNWKLHGLHYRYYVIAFFVIGYIFPFVVMVTLYTLMGIKLWHGTVPGVQTAEAINRIKRGRRKATKMLITVVIAFALCWLPLQLAEILHLFAPAIYELIPFKLNLLLPYFGIMNSVVNPLIYIIFCEKFRFEFSRILCRCPRAVDMEGSWSSKSFNRFITHGKSGSSVELVTCTRRSITTKCP